MTQPRYQDRSTLRARASAIVWSATLAFLILAFGQGVWGLLLITNLRTSPAVPWSALAMAPILWGMWKYLSGEWWPRKTSAARRSYLRATSVSARIYLWTYIAGALSVVALAGYWIVLFSFVKMSPNPLPSLSQYPLVTVVLVGVTASLVSPLTEEAAFRGYCQVILERTFPGIMAVVISSVLFALAHLTQGFFLAKLFVYFLAGLVFGIPAYLAKSTLPTIPVHITADLTFFAFVWPHDGSRHMVRESGLDLWLVIHVLQTLVFTILAVLAFCRLARIVTESRAMHPSAIATEPWSLAD